MQNNKIKKPRKVARIEAWICPNTRTVEWRAKHTKPSEMLLMAEVLREAAMKRLGPMEMDDADEDNIRGGNR